MRFFTVVLAVLVFWVLGFLVDDIRDLPGPNYQETEQKHIDPELLAKKQALDRQIEELTRLIDNQKERQRLIGDSSRNLQETINQLLELQKLSLQKSIALTGTEQTNFSNSLTLFLDNQKKYQEMTQKIADMLEEKQKLVHDKQEAAEKIEQQRRAARDEFSSLDQKHRLKLAFLQLAILLPILAVAVVVIVRKRSTLYFPLYLAFGAATLVKVALVIHEYFPSRLFKYVLIGGLLIAVIRLLVYFIRAIAFPKPDSLLRHYREAYERFLCPSCEYPIRTGPRRFLFWTRRTVNKTPLLGEQKIWEDEPYTCPSCGSVLFEECPACHKIRHAMLPNCYHCGASKQVLA